MDVRQEGCRTEEMKERRDAGNEGCGKERCRKGVIKGRRDLEMEI